MSRRNAKPPFPTDYVPSRAEARAMTEAQLLSLAQSGLTDTATGIRKICVAYLALLDKGSPFAVNFPPAIKMYAERVESETLSPAILFTHGNDMPLLGAIARLVPEEQAKFLDPATKVQVRLRDKASGEFVTRAKRLGECTVTEIAVLTKGDRIQPPEVQEKIIRQMEPKAPPPPKPALAKPAPAPTVSRGRDFNVVLLLSERQMKAVADAAAQKGMSPATFLKDHLIRHKVIPSR